MNTKIFLKCPYCKKDIRIKISSLNRLSIIDDKLKEHEACPYCGKVYKLYMNEDYKYCYLMALIPMLAIDFILFYLSDLNLFMEIVFFLISLFVAYYLLSLFNYRLYKKKIIRLIPIDKEYIILEDEDVL